MQQSSQNTDDDRDSRDLGECRRYYARDYKRPAEHTCRLVAATLPSVREKGRREESGIDDPIEVLDHPRDT